MLIVLLMVVTGMSLPGPHVEESWQAAEFYNNKVKVSACNQVGKAKDDEGALIVCTVCYLVHLLEVIKPRHQEINIR